MHFLGKNVNCDLDLFFWPRAKRLKLGLRVNLRALFHELLALFLHPLLQRPLLRDALFGRYFRPVRLDRCDRTPGRVEGGNRAHNHGAQECYDRHKKRQSGSDLKRAVQRDHSVGRATVFVEANVSAIKIEVAIWLVTGLSINGQPACNLPVDTTTGSHFAIG